MDENGQPLVEPVESAPGEPRAQRSAIDTLLGRNKTSEAPAAGKEQVAPASREVEPGKCPNPNCSADLPLEQTICEVCGYNRRLS